VRLVDDSLEEEELQNLVDEIVTSFLHESVEREKFERLRMRDILEHQYNAASEHLNQEREEYFALAEQLGGAESAVGKFRMELALEDLRANRADRREILKRLADAYLQHQLDLVDAGALTLGQQRQDGDREADAPAGAGGATVLVHVDEQDLDDDARRQVRRSRAEYAVIQQVTAERMEALDEAASTISDEVEKLSRSSAELQARREALERGAELVHRMGEKLARWDVELAADARVERWQPAVIDRPVRE
jgi:hypothetical protein